MNSFRIHLFFLVLVVCSCNQDAESKEEESPNKNSGKTTNTSGYSVADIDIFSGNSKTMYLGNFDESRFESVFGENNVHGIEDGEDYYVSWISYSIDQKGIRFAFPELFKQTLYGYSQNGEVTGAFLIANGKARMNGLSGGYDVYVNLELIKRYHGSFDDTRLLAASYRPLENTSSPMEVEKLTSREVGEILDRRISASDIAHAHRYTTDEGVYVVVNLYEYPDYSEIFLFQEENGRYQSLSLERQTDYNSSKFKSFAWESYMSLSECIMLPVSFNESPLIFVDLGFGCGGELALFRLSDRGNSYRSDRVSSQTYEYESYGDRRMGKEIMRKSVDSQGRITWFYEGEKIGKHRLNHELKGGQEYVYFDSSPSKKYAIEYSRCGFTCRHPSGKTQFYSQVAPPCRN
ncbi:MAG: hypothetical protein CMN34_03775 [Saprospirales bacterium]|nr:hypothetical protein [Saprospirales bacterium]